MHSPAHELRIEAPIRKLRDWALKNDPDEIDAADTALESPSELLRDAVRLTDARSEFSCTGVEQHYLL